MENDERKLEECYREMLDAKINYFSKRLQGTVKKHDLYLVNEAVADWEKALSKENSLFIEDEVAEIKKRFCVELKRLNKLKQTVKLKDSLDEAKKKASAKAQRAKPVYLLVHQSKAGLLSNIEAYFAYDVAVRAMDKAVQVDRAVVILKETEDCFTEDQVKNLETFTNIKSKTIRVGYFGA